MFDKEFFNNYSPAKDLLKDKVILITGAGAGIGKAAALTFAQYGATVILLGRTLQKLEEVYDEIERQGLAQPAIFPMNLESASDHDYQAMHDSINEEFGRLDGLLHNASELGPRTPLTNYPSEQWQKLLQVNLTAPFIMTKSLVPLLSKSQNASIVFTGSSVGIKGRAFWGAYAVTKAGCENMVEILADEFDGTNNIRVNSINPGGTRTRMRASAYPAENPSSVPPAEDIMKPYLFLLGDDSKDVNGTQLNAQPKN
ncbi:YciK family oxidoreductase [Agarilytica rhodophyticola]|uniref:YciK family oxidoreductase n=1 Tax=Agarilytica rhodophyticola TaxID=1737490 RepID=UPI000B34857F|nr:YciK family oxidoreductase [Agarilytica rhodophyticola]